MVMIDLVAKSEQEWERELRKENALAIRRYKENLKGKLILGLEVAAAIGIPIFHICFGYIL